MKMIKKVVDVAHHRNGVHGTPFDVVLFKDKDTGELFVGILPDCDQNEHNSFVLSVDRMSKGSVTFAENSWRGDNYAQELKQAVTNNYDFPII